MQLYRTGPDEWAAHVLETDKVIDGATVREVLRKVCLHAEAVTGCLPPRGGRR